MTEERKVDLSIVELTYGAHREEDDEFCFMELVAYLAGEPWTDNPACVCPLLSELFRNWNDTFSEDDDRRRTAELLPYLRRVTGTNLGEDVCRARMALCAVWHAHLQAWLIERVLGDAMTPQAQRIVAGLRAIKRVPEPVLQQAYEATYDTENWTYAITDWPELSDAQTLFDGAAVSWDFTFDDPRMLIFATLRTYLGAAPLRAIGAAAGYSGLLVCPTDVCAVLATLIVEARARKSALWHAMPAIAAEFNTKCKELIDQLIEMKGPEDGQYPA